MDADGSREPAISTIKDTPAQPPPGAMFPPHQQVRAVIMAAIDVLDFWMPATHPAAAPRGGRL